MSLQIQLAQDEGGLPVFVFTSASSKKPVRVELGARSRKDIGTKNDLLFRSLGKNRDSGKRVLDLTAGLLRDALHMIELGFSVTAVERNAELGKALEEWLQQQPVRNLELVRADAFDYLQVVSQPPDIIYIDPMFPDLGSSALSSKEAQLLKQLVGTGDESESAELLKLAIGKAKERVIVKRPRKAGLLAPDFQSQVLGKSTRYDVYKGKAD